MLRESAMSKLAVEAIKASSMTDKHLFVFRSDGGARKFFDEIKNKKNEWWPVALINYDGGVKYKTWTIHKMEE